CDCNHYRLDLLGGFRYVQFDENLQFSEATAGVLGGFTPGSVIGTTDQFNTQNRFYGGQLGLRFEGQSGPWFLNATAKVALGEMHESVGIGGLTTTSGLGLPTTTAQGGFFALSTNSGRFTRDRFAVVPEGIFQVGYQVSSRLRLFVGYDFLYLSDVARPGNQIDHTINPTQLPFLFGNGGTLVGPA